MAHVLNGVEIIVRQHQPAGGFRCSHLAQIHRQPVFVPSGPMSLRRAEVQVAPVDAQIVAATTQNRLNFRPCRHTGQALDDRPRPDHGLTGIIHGNVGGCFEVDRDAMGLSIGGSYRKSHVGHRPGQQVDAIRQARCHERERQCHGRRAELVDGSRRQDGHAGLRQGGGAGRLHADHTPRLAIDGERAVQSLWFASPVRGVTFGELVGG